MLYRSFTNHELLAKDVKEILFKKRMTESELAKAIGYSKSTVANYISGFSQSRAMAQALVNYFQLDERKYSKL